MIKIGDYVTAELIDGENREPRQGVYIHDFEDGTILVAGEIDNYRCYTAAAVVPDSNLHPDTLEKVRAIRRNCKEIEGGSEEVEP